MAKQGKSIFKVDGTIDGKTFLKTVDGKIVRKARTKNSGRANPSFIEQKERTGYLNKVASEINQIAYKFAGHMTKRLFYRSLLKLFRKEPKLNRFLLLHQLKGVDITKQSIDKFSSQELIVVPETNHFEIELQITATPPLINDKLNCYYYDVMLVTWKGYDENGTVEIQSTEWCEVKRKLPVFDFRFKRDARTTNWLVMLRIHFGINEVRPDLVESSMSKIMDVGTFIDFEQAILDEREKAEKEAQKKALSHKKEVEMITRVKARE